MAEGRWIWGRRPVLEALRAGNVTQVLIRRNARDASILKEIQEVARLVGLEVRFVDSAELETCTHGQVDQGVAALVADFTVSDLDTLLSSAANSQFASLFLVLDQIQDPRNLGSLIRTADGAGVDGIILTRRRSAGLTSIVDKASSGAIHHACIALVPNLAEAIGRLKRANVWIVALDSGASQTIYECDLTMPTALIVGGEGTGVRRLTADRADMVASIPMQGHVGSLNASVAGAIALFEAVRQRRSR